MDGRKWGSRNTTYLKHQQLTRVHTCKSLICEDQTEEGIKSKQIEKLETIATIYCEFKNVSKYQYVVWIRWLWAWMQMKCQEDGRLSCANLSQQIRWPWWSLYFSLKFSADKLLEDDIENLNWAMTLTIWKFHQRTGFKSQTQRGSQLQCFNYSKNNFFAIWASTENHKISIHILGC